jgi:isochorismate hydrolase
MKQAYFTPETIRSEAEQMLQAAQRIRRRGAPGFELARSALLILDMQEYFLDEASHAYIPSAPAILPGLQALISAYSKAGLPVIFTRHLNTPEQAGMMAVWWQDLIRPENPLSEITTALDLSAGLVLEKSQYDAFYKTGLESALRVHEVEVLVICGLMSHLCCETTARAAFVRGFEVLFPVDGTATYNRAFHEAALLNLSHGFAIPALVAEILVELGEQGEPG